MTLDMQSEPSQDLPSLRISKTPAIDGASRPARAQAAVTACGAPRTAIAARATGAPATPPRRPFGYNRKKPPLTFVEENPRPAPHEITDYDSLLRLLRARADQLQISRSTIDHISGLQEGMSAKILSLNRLRRIGVGSLGPLLSALCLRLVAIPDDEAFARNKSRYIRRDDAHYRSARKGHDNNPKPKPAPKPKPPGKWPFKKMKGIATARLGHW